MPIRPDHDISADLQYMLVRSRRRTLSLIVREDGQLEVRCPLKFPKHEIDRFIREKAGWIERKRNDIGQVISIGPLPAGQIDQAIAILRRRFAEILLENEIKGPAVLRIRDQRSRWGSCSNRGSIAVNSRCALLPAHLQEYVMLHELCHLQHMNHGAGFWRLLEFYLPDARKRRQALNRYRLIRENEGTPQYE